jgi:hypothetical protein
LNTPSQPNGVENDNAIQSFDDVIAVVGGYGRYQWRLFLVSQCAYFAVTGTLLQVGII